MAASISLYKFNGSAVQAAGVLDLSLIDTFAETEISPVIVSTYLRVIANNLRQYTASTKTRGEVSYSNKKPWKQKGTGNARCGDRKSPLWRHGGVLFGPRPGGHKLAINRKMARLAWANVFQRAFAENLINCLDFSDADIPQEKTAHLVRGILSTLGIDSSKRMLLLLSLADIHLIRVFRNFPNIVIDFFGREDIRNLTTVDKIIFLKKDKDLFENMVAKNGLE